ncbi:adenylyl-sulfate kinase [Cohnella pontilimi]|nr:adenylyl-sulfate kinase [Cohnella pontilimi]
MPNGVIIWFTGHSKSGKTTLTKSIEKLLQHRGCKAIRLDSDTLPMGIIKPEGHSWEERQQRKNENLIFLSKLLMENGYYVLISSVGRFSKWRELLRSQVSDYLEIYLKCPLEVRLQRDVTGKYVSHPDYFHVYEEPENPDLAIDTSRVPIPEATELILRLFTERGYLQNGE